MKRKTYPSDLTDEQWEILKPHIPQPKPGGRPASHERREIVNGILYVLRTGCGWEYLPHDLPPWKTVHDYFRQWSQSGVWETINQALTQADRQRTGRDPAPSAIILDTQSVKTTEKGG